MVRKKISIFLILFFVIFSSSFMGVAQPDKNEKSVKWHYFFAAMQLYIKNSIKMVDQGGKIIEPYVKRFNQIETKNPYDKNKMIKDLSVEIINELSFLQDQLNQLQPPEGFALYHQKANQVFTVLISFVGSSAKEGKLQEYAEDYLPLLIDMSQEIKTNYTKHKIPQEYINNQEHRIDEITLSLLKYKEFKKKIRALDY